jgi:hypothetical protein
VNKLCAAVALACVLAALAAASAAPATSAASAPAGTASAPAGTASAPAGAAPAASAAASAPSLGRAEAAARRALAPLVVERALCIAQARRRVVCFFAHPDAGPRQCRSVVLVRARRVRVLQSNVCFEFRKVTP